MRKKVNRSDARRRAAEQAQREAEKLPYKVVYRNPPGRTCYIYECPRGHQQEEWHSAQESPTITCRTCGSKRTHRVLNTCTFHLRGRGFPSRELKIDREIQKQDEIMAEGWRSQSEIAEAGEMLKEREARLVKEGQKVLKSSEHRQGKVGAEMLKKAAKRQWDMMARR